VLLHHQHGPAVGSEAGEPAQQELVQSVLADANRRVRPDGGEAHVVGDAIGVDDPHVVERRGVRRGQRTGSLVHVDGPDGGIGGAAGQGDGHRSVATAEVEQVAGRRRSGRFEQQELRPGVDAVTGEDAAIGLQISRQVGQREADRGRIGRHVRLVVEVVGQGEDGSVEPMQPYSIRIVGDPVLRQRANEVTDIDGRLAAIVEGMTGALYEASGLAVAAPQVGVLKRLFVYDMQEGDGPQVIVNPVINESGGEWVYEEGCLSVPGLAWEIVRPKQVLVTGVDLDGNDISFEADELLARMFQHEIDHLDGVLLLDRLDEDQRKEAKRAVRQLQFDRDH
jgi:peptide deformylase